MSASTVTASFLLNVAFSAWYLAVPASADSPPNELPKPYLIVEAEMDRPYVSDLYVYDFTGKQLKRLTSSPLPTCAAVAASRNGSAVAFVANAMALYVLSLQPYWLRPIHTGNSTATTFSNNGRWLAYVAGSFAKPRDQIVRITEVYCCKQRRQEWHPGIEICDLDFAPGDDQLLATVWRNDRAQIALIDPDSQQNQTLLEERECSYFLQAVSPDGHEVLFVSSDLKTEADSLNVLEWPSKNLRKLQTFPRNKRLQGAKYAHDGKHIVFLIDGIVAMSDADGKNIVGLNGPMPSSDAPKLLGRR